MSVRSEQRLASSPVLVQPNPPRNTASACRQKAAENRALARTVQAGSHRTLLQLTAAAWSVHADRLERQEARVHIETRGTSSENANVRL